MPKVYADRLHTELLRPSVRAVRPNGIAIRELRKARKISLPVLAERIGRDRGHLSRLERGQAGASDETVRRIAAALEVPTDAITHKERET